MFHICLIWDFVVHDFVAAVPVDVEHLSWDDWLVVTMHDRDVDECCNRKRKLFMLN